MEVISVLGPFYKNTNCISVPTEQAWHLLYPNMVMNLHTDAGVSIIDKKLYAPLACTSAKSDLSSQYTCAHDEILGPCLPIDTQ